MLKEYKTVIQNKKFLYIWMSQIFSQLTINVMNFILLTRLFEITGSAISTSLLWVSYALPAMLFGPLASGIVDLVDKRTILMATNLLQSLAIFSYAFLGHSNVFVVYVLVFIYSLLNQFYVPSEASTLPAVLKQGKLAHGNSLFFMTQQASIVLGFTLAGILRSLLSFKNTLFLSAAFVFIAFIFTSFLPKIKPEKKISSDLDEAVFDFFRHIKEGYNFLKGERKVLTPVLLLIGFQVALQLCIVQFPILAQYILSIPLNLASFYILVPAGLGAVMGAVFIPKILKRDIRKKTVIDEGLPVIFISLLLISFLIPYLGGFLKIFISFALFVFLGFGFVSVLIPSQTFLQQSTPENMRGRVFGNFSFLVTVTSVLPVLFSGTLVEAFGIKVLLSSLSICIVMVYVLSRKFGDRFLNG